METAILGGVIKEIIFSLGSFAYNEIARVQGVKDEIEKLEDSLRSITLEIRDAGRIIAHSEATNQRLKTLTDIAYEAESIIDRFKIEMGMLGTSRSPVTNPTIESQTNCCMRMLRTLQGWNGSLVRRPCREVRTRHQAANDIERLNQRLDDMRARRNVLGELTAMHQSNHHDDIGPSYDEARSVGGVLANDCYDHVRRLRADSEVLFAIVGAPGVGKTTLARKIYHESRRAFRTRWWAHVSTATGNLTIWRSVDGEPHQRDPSAPIAEQMERIRHLLCSGDAADLLLVIDNVRDHDGWDFLGDGRRRQVLLARRVRVLVTTPHCDVARRMGVTERSCCHRVAALEEDDGWLLLCSFAQLDPGHASGSVEYAGRRIVRECSGVPAALEAVGSNLRARDGVEHWDGERGEDFVATYAEIRRSIDAGYMDLGYRLKRCFLYCALYPEGSLIDQRHLLQQWIAEGFFDGTRPERQEKKARRCYKELVERSLLVPAANNGAGASATMPALLRSYAIYRSQDENCAGDPSNIGNEISIKTWRVSVADGSAVRAIPEGVTTLRTLMVLGGGSSSPQQAAGGVPPPRLQLVDDICRRFKSLRVLDLRGAHQQAAAETTAVSHLLGKLVQLRYLNLSNTRITALPPEVGKLAVLQFLVLRNCRCLTSLPEEVGRLSRLRSLDISGTPELRDIRFGLANLRELNCFRGFLPVPDAGAGGNNNNQGWAFRELGSHSELTSLHILKISSNTSWREAAELQLNNKSRLKDLELCCTPTLVGEPPMLLDDDDDGDAAEAIGLSAIGRVLNALMPPEDLASLKLANFYGAELPFWLSPSHLTGLKRLTLHGCSTHCHRLPPLGEMRNLEFLAVAGFNALLEIGAELRGSPIHGEAAFRRLEQLSLAGMRNLETWTGIQPGDMPLLRHFQISRCPRLPLPQWLQHCAALTSLKALRANGVTEVASLPALRELEVVSCSSLDRICSLGRLQVLRIDGCSRLQAVRGVPRLRFLRLHEHTRELPQSWLPPLRSIRRLEVVGSEELLDKCYRGLALHGTVVRQLAAGHVCATKQDDGSLYFSYTSSTRQFLHTSLLCIERAHSYRAFNVLAPQRVRGTVQRLVFYVAVLIAVQCFVLWTWIQ